MLIRPLAVKRAKQILERRTGVSFSLATMYRWIHEGKIEVIDLNGNYRIPWDEIERLCRAAKAGLKCQR